MFAELLTPFHRDTLQNFASIEAVSLNIPAEILAHNALVDWPYEVAKTNFSQRWQLTLRQDRRESLMQRLKRLPEPETSEEKLASCYRQTHDSRVAHWNKSPGRSRMRNFAGLALSKVLHQSVCVAER